MYLASGIKPCCYVKPATRKDGKILIAFVSSELAAVRTYSLKSFVTSNRIGKRFALARSHN